MSDQNYYVLKKDEYTKVSKEEFLRTFDILRDYEKKTGKTIFHHIIDYTDSYLIKKVN